ncbi:MAG: Fur family transcriptional regulator [Minisyncoccia bacterium]
MIIKERLTIQKKTILDYLKSTKSHPDGDAVYLEVKRKIPTISKGTVYRILNQLEERGEIQTINLDKTHFDGDTSWHAHFICENCNKIYDIFLNEDDIQKIKQKIKVGKINKIKLLFYGKCNQC